MGIQSQDRGPELHVRINKLVKLFQYLLHMQAILSPLEKLIVRVYLIPSLKYKQLHPYPTRPFALFHRIGFAIVRDKVQLFVKWKINLNEPLQVPKNECQMYIDRKSVV